MRRSDPMARLSNFATGKRLWVEIVCDSVRADFIGTLLYLTETAGDHYDLCFQGGFTLSFTTADLEAGRVACHQYAVPEEENR